jgi:hypothetical protein
MGEESTRLKSELPGMTVSTASGTMDGKSDSGGKDGAEGKEVPAVEISRLRTEIDATRDQLGTYISELDRRRHEALDLKHQVKKHPGLVIGAGVAIIGAVAGAVVMVNHARRHETLGQKVQRNLTCIASPPPTAPADPAWMLKLFLKAALLIGIAVATRLLSEGTTRRPPAA